MSVLYLSYDGLMEQLGQSQILPYLRQLAKGRKITLITYEKKQDINDPERKARFQKFTHDAGIYWLPLRYHKGPGILAKIYDLTIGFIVGAFKCLTGKVRIVHARGYMVSVISLALKQVFGIQFIFDMRGFWVDQRVEMGMWNRDSRIFRIAKWLEIQFIQKADVVFALNNATVETIKKWPAVQGQSIRFEVVTTCTDLEIFKPPPDTFSIKENIPFTLGYVGNAGEGYLFEPVLDLYSEIQKVQTKARLMIVNRNDHILILDLIRKHGLDSTTIELGGCDHKDVPKKMWQMDAGIFIVRPDPSRISSVPTRLGEFLACGVPCVGNAGIGGVEGILEDERVGVVLRNFDSESVKAAAASLVGIAAERECKTRCIKSAKLHFSLEAGVATYEKAYRDLEGSAR